MDPLEFLTTKNSLLRGVMQGVAQSAREKQRQLDRERANMTAYEIMVMLSASFKKG